MVEKERRITMTTTRTEFKDEGFFVVLYGHEVCGLRGCSDCTDGILAITVDYDLGLDAAPPPLEGARRAAFCFREEDITWAIHPDSMVHRRADWRRQRGSDLFYAWTATLPNTDRDDVEEWMDYRLREAERR